MLSMREVLRQLGMGVALVIVTLFGVGVYLSYFNPHKGASDSLSMWKGDKVAENLRADIDLSYKETYGHGLPYINGAPVIDEVISKYIPQGTSFEYAEKLLDHAGFIMESCPISLPSQPGDVMCHAILKIIGTGLIKSSLSIYLYPEDPKTFKKINRVKASFFTDLP